MEISTTEEWITFLDHAMSVPPMMIEYKRATGKTPPAVDQDVPRDLLAAPPPGPMADYLYWVTLSYWGRNGVKQKFFDRAKKAWPKVLLPREVLEDER